MFHRTYVYFAKLGQGCWAQPAYANSPCLDCECFIFLPTITCVAGGLSRCGERSGAPFCIPTMEVPDGVPSQCRLHSRIWNKRLEATPWAWEELLLAAVELVSFRRLPDRIIPTWTISKIKETYNNATSKIFLGSSCISSTVRRTWTVPCCVTLMVPVVHLVLL